MTANEEWPSIYVSIHLNKRLGVLPPFAQKSVQISKSIVFLASTALLAYLALNAEDSATFAIRVAACAGVAWMIWDRVLRGERYGRSHILVTSRGLLFSEHNLYVDWEDVESYRVDGSMLKFQCRPGTGPTSWFAKSQLEIPITAKNEAILKETFRERVRVSG